MSDSSTLSIGTRDDAAARYRTAVSDIPEVLELVADVCQAPMVALKVAGDTTAHFAATLGLPVAAVEVPRAMSLCGMVSAIEDAMVVDDAESDPRLAAHPLVAGSTHVRFLAAAPLHHAGHVVGAICVFDTSPRRTDAATTRRFLARIARRIDTETSLRHLVSRQQAFRGLVDEDEVVTAVSHEMRTPLAAIQGNLELLADAGDALSPAYAQRLEAIQRNATRLGRTVDNLLRAANHTRHDVIARNSVIDLGAVALHVAAQPGIATHRLVVDLPDRPALIHADERLVAIALHHLVSNALTHGDPEHPVSIVVTDRPEPAVEVRDHGPGLDDSELGRLGTAFFRGNRARTDETPGLGLGLSITHRILAAQGGRLSMRSAPGAGVTARIGFGDVRA